VRTGVFPGRWRASGAKGCVLSNLVLNSASKAAVPCAKVIMQTDPSAHHGPIGPFQHVWHLVNAAAAPPWPTSHPATRSPTPHSATEPAADSIRGPAPVVIDRSGPRSRISTSAVTVKVAKRSASGPDTAGASGPGLAPPPGAARSILQVRRAAYRPRTATAAGCRGPPRLVERSREEARIRTHQAGPQPPAFVDQNTGAC
jgi:hypothetical protein